MDLVFNKCYAAPNQVNKYDYYAGEDLVISGTFRGECDIVNPVFLVEYDVLKIIDYNYILVYDLKKFYFINNIVIINNNLVEIYCSEDVLTSCWYFTDSGLRDLNVFVDRNEFSYNENLDDTMIPQRNTLKMFSKDVSLTNKKGIPLFNFNNDYNYIVVFSQKSYIVEGDLMTQTGVGYFTSTSNTIYACNKLTLAHILAKVNGAGEKLFGSELHESVIGVYYVGLSAINTLFSWDVVAEDESYNIGVVGNSIEFVVFGKLYRLYSDFNDVDVVEKVIDFDDWRDNIPHFLLNKKYSYCKVFLPRVGDVEVDSICMLGRLTVRYSFCISTLTFSVNIYSSVLGNVFTRSNLPLGVSIPFTGSNATERQRNVLLGTIGIVGGVAGALSGNAAGIGFISYGSKQLISPETTTVKYSHRKGQVSSITKSTTPAEYGEGDKKVNYGKIIDYVSSSTVGLARALTHHAHECVASSGDGSFYDLLQNQNITVRLFIPDYYIPYNYAHLIGRPCQFNEKLKNINGYTLISGFHLHNIHGLNRTELDMLDSILRSGIILPNPPSIFSSEDGGNGNEEFKVYSENDNMMPVVDNEEISVYSENVENEVEVNSEQSTQVDDEEIEQSKEEIEVNQEEIEVNSKQSIQIDSEEVEQIEMSEESYKEMVLRKLSE